MRDQQDHPRRPGGDRAADADLAYLALDPEMEARMRSRRAAAHERRQREAQTAGAQEKALRRFGPYELIEELGEGPAAVVWRARGPDQLECAVKLLRSTSVAGSAVARQRSDSLMELGPRLAAIDHPALVRIRGVEAHDGRVGLVMELLDGRTLTERVRDEGPLPLAQVVGLGEQVCGALSALHAADLLHLDVKPRNVMLAADGRAVLMDVGTVRAIAPEADDREIALSGTPQYMAPELLRGQPPTPATDVYALGVTLYYAAAASFPVKGPMVRELRAAHTQGRSTQLAQARPQWPPALTAAVDRAIALDPAARFASVAQLQEALRGASGALHAPTQESSSRAARTWRSLPAPARLALSVAGLGLLLLVMWLGSR